jgi:hypothetical protein
MQPNTGCVYHYGTHLCVVNWRAGGGGGGAGQHLINSSHNETWVEAELSLLYADRANIQGGSTGN